MAEQLAPIPFDSWLAKQDMQFVRRDDASGAVIVKDPAGNERPINVDAVRQDMMKTAAAKGAPPEVLKGFEKAPFRYNTPNTPIEMSPLDASERTLVNSYGNTKGATAFLKKKFDDVQYNPEKGLVVNNKGVWQTVDPSGLGSGSAWDKTKELWKDINDNHDIAISMTATGVGAAQGAAYGAPLGPAGAIAGGILGAGLGAAGSAALRTTFGRLNGTYDATPEEEFKDVGMETLMGMAGQAAAPGVQAGLGSLVATGKTLAKTVGAAGQDLLAETYGMITGVGSPAMRALFDNAGKMVGQMKGLVAKAGPGADYAAIRSEALKDGINDMSKLAEAAHGALPRRYGKYINELLDEAGDKGFTADMGDIASEAMRSIEAAGLGKFAPKVSKSGLKARAKIETAGRTMPDPVADISKGTVEFQPHTIESAAQAMAQGENAIGLTPDMVKQIRPIIDNILAMGKQGKLEGREGAAALVSFQKNLNRLKDSAFRSKADPALEQVTMAASNGFEQGVSKAFDKVGLGARYAEKSQLYSQYSNAADKARQIVRDATGGKAEDALKIVLGSADKRLSATGVVKQVVELAGDNMGKDVADETFKNILLRDAASKFAAFRPRFGPAGSGVQAAATVIAGQHALTKGVVATGGSLLGGLGTAGAAGAAAAQFSPRLVAGQTAIAQKGVQYAGKFLDFVKSLPPDQLKQFIGNDKALGAALSATMKGFMSEDAATKELLQRGGVQ